MSHRYAFCAERADGRRLNAESDGADPLMALRSALDGGKVADWISSAGDEAIINIVKVVEPYEPRVAYPDMEVDYLLDGYSHIDALRMFNYIDGELTWSRESNPDKEGRSVFNKQVLRGEMRGHTGRIRDVVIQAKVWMWFYFKGYVPRNRSVFNIIHRNGDKSDYSIDNLAIVKRGDASWDDSIVEPIPVANNVRDGRSHKEHRPELFKKQDGVCNGCGRRYEEKDFTVDHVDPAGGDDIENCQLLCGNCNSRKGQRTMDDLRESLRRDGIVE